MKEVSSKLSLGKEAQFFEERNKKALKRLSARQCEPLRPSPITGEPMKKEVVYGVVIDRCEKSGGIWLDAGELEEILAEINPEGNDENSNWISCFFKGLTEKPTSDK